MRYTTFTTHQHDANTHFAKCQNLLDRLDRFDEMQRALTQATCIVEQSMSKLRRCVCHIAGRTHRIAPIRRQRIPSIAEVAERAAAVLDASCAAPQRTAWLERLRPTLIPVCAGDARLDVVAARGTRSTFLNETWPHNTPLTRGGDQSGVRHQDERKRRSALRRCFRQAQNSDINEDCALDCEEGHFVDLVDEVCEVNRVGQPDTWGVLGEWGMASRPDRFYTGWVRARERGVTLEGWSTADESSLTYHSTSNESSSGNVDVSTVFRLQASNVIKRHQITLLGTHSTSKWYVDALLLDSECFSSLSMWPSLCRYSAWCDRSSQSSRSFIALHAITVYSRPSIINRLSLQSLCWISFLFGAASSFSDILRLLACFIEATTDIFGYGPLIMSHGAESHVTCWDTTVVRFSGNSSRSKLHPLCQNAGLDYLHCYNLH